MIGGLVSPSMLDRFILAAQTEIESIEAPLIAMEQTDRRGAFDVEVEILDRAADNLEKYKEIMDALLVANLEIQQKTNESGFLSTGRTALYWIASGAIFIGSLTTVVANTSEETKAAILWCDSALITLMGVVRIWKGCSIGSTASKATRDFYKELEQLCHQIRVINALRNSLHTMNGYAKSRERLQQVQNTRRKELRYKKMQGERNTPLRAKVSVQMANIVQSPSITDNERSDEDE